MEHAPTETVGQTILDFISVLAKRRRFIVWFVLICTILGGAVAIVLPKWYKAKTTLFPAEQANLFPGLEGVSSLVKTLSPGKGLGLGGATEVDRYIAILKSERVMDSVISRFGLVRTYDFEGASYAMEKTRKELAGNTVIELEDEGNLSVSVYDRDPQQAAAMANMYVELLNATNSELQAQNARGNREFVEQRYEKNLLDLRKAEESMKAFQLKYGVIAMPEQTEASIKAAAEISARLAAKEIELNVLRRTLSPTHSAVQEAEIEIQEIRRKLADMNSGSKDVPGEMKVLVPFRQTPQLAVDYLRLYRETEIQYKILQFITPLFEQAKVEEQRSTPSVVVLDRAMPPERKAKPKISLYLLMAFVLSALFSILLVFGAEGVGRLRSANPRQYDALRQTLRSDWFGLRLRKRSASDASDTSVR